MLVDPRGLAPGDVICMGEVCTVEGGGGSILDLNRARGIAKEELMKRPNGHNDAEDAMRHAEWSRRMVQETNSFTAWVAGTGHEIDNLLNDNEPWSEAVMELVRC